MAQILLLTTGCNTKYGYEYVEQVSIQAGEPKLYPLELERNLKPYYVHLQESQKRQLRDFRTVTCLGERDYLKKYEGYSDSELAVLFPISNAFPCIAWGIKSITGNQGSDRAAQVPPSVFHGLACFTPPAETGTAYETHCGTPRGV